MTASIKLSPEYQLKEIAEAAGQPDLHKRRYVNGELIVEGISQSALDAAVAAYDPLPMLKVAKRQELLLAFKAEYAQLWIIDGVAVAEWKDLILGKAAAQRTAAESAKVSQANTLFTQIQTKLADVRNATTEAQVQAITWA